MSAERRKENAKGQKPRAVIVTCSDSRVIPEAVFSCGIGELFVIRTAGNVIGASELASIEYAVEHLGTDTVVVLGHTACGAVSAALHGESGGHVGAVTGEIIRSIGDEKDPYRACVLNVESGVNRIRREFPRPRLCVCGAVYGIGSGRTEFLAL